MATLMLFCELILFIICSKYNQIYYTIGIIDLKSIDFFLLHSMFFYIFKKSTYFMYVAYNRFNPAFGLQMQINHARTGASFSTFSWGANFFLFFNATGLLKNWKKQPFICSNLTLFIVPFFLSFFFSYFSLLSFSFSFSLGGGRRPPSPLKWRPCARRTKLDRKDLYKLQLYS